MKPLAARFFVAGLLVLLCGLALGFYMAIGDDSTLMPVHAHLNLVGFVAMTLYGLFYQVVPGATAGRWPIAHFWLALVAALCLPAGMALIILDHPGAGEPISFLGMVAMTAAALVFGRAILHASRAGGEGRER